MLSFHRDPPGVGIRTEVRMEGDTRRRGKPARRSKGLPRR